jgi:putative colanic acid biosynthesis acetyltransferase WcaF
MPLDIAANRQAAKWSRRAQIARIVWALVHPLFALSPRPFWGWRRFLLRCFGARIGHAVHVYPSVRITIPWNIAIGNETAIGDRVILYALGPITIGAQVTVSQYAHLCAGSHDYRDPAMPLLKPAITIGDGAWICADAFVGPGVSVAAGAIAGARAVVVSDVAANAIVAGNPARPIGQRA